jgi:conjugal transfer/type IV secretion protein DotA/TraY
MSDNIIFPPIAPGDISLKFLDTIMGFGSYSTIIGGVWFWLNTAAAMLGMTYILYILVVGVFNTGHKGEVLGRWSEYWVPMKIAFAVAMFVPTVNNASLVQYAMYQAGRLGISGANAVWKVTVDLLGKQAAPISSMTSPDVETFAKGYFLNQVCAISANMLAQKAGYSDGFIVPRTIKKPDEWSIYMDGNKRRGIRTAACGGFTFAQGDQALREAEDKLIGVKTKQPGLVAQIVGGRVALMNDYTATVQSVAIKMAKAGIEGSEMPTMADAQTLSTALDKFQGGMNRELQQLLSAYRGQAQSNAKALLDDFGDAATQWSTAGLWMIRIADMNGVILRAAQTVPEIHRPTYGGFSKDSRDVLQRTGDQASTWWDGQLSALGNRKSLQRAYNAGTGNSIWSMIGLSDHLVDLFIIDSGENPVGDLVAFGHKMIWAFEAATVATATIAGSAEAAKSTDGPMGWALSAVGVKAGSGFIAGAVNFLGPIISLVLLSLLIVGIQLAYLLPLTPFLFWAHSMTSWLVRFTLAILGAPLWAIAHLSPSGDELVSETAKSGYGLALEVFFRPVVMVISLVIGLMILTLMGGFVTMFYYPAMRAALGTNNPDFILGAIVMMFIVTTLMMGIANQCFRLLATAPDELMGLLGFRASGDGEKAVNAVDTTARQAAYGTSNIQSIVRDGLTASKKPLSHDDVTAKNRDADQRRGKYDD